MKQSVKQSMSQSSTSSAVAASTKASAKEHGVFSYGNDIIRYDVVRKASRSNTQKVLIKVHPDQRVVATAPKEASEQAIHEAMLKRARWIWQNLQSFAEQKDYVLPKRYISGESQFYLGRRYVLKVISDPEQVMSVKLSRGKLNVVLRQDSSAMTEQQRARKVKPLIDNWYQQKAKAIFHERLNELLPKATWVTGIPSFRIMAMKKQWGSCSAKGNLMLNPHLVKAPKECIDYVILHELCHIAEHNHSERFWRLLTQVMPNWKAVKAKLDGMAEQYLNE